MPALPHGVYAIADGSAGRPVLELVRAFVKGGAGVVQLRMKEAGSRQFLDLSREARKICAREKVLLLVNDRPDIARLAEADGVHLGQEDLTLAEARRIVGPGMIIGISTHCDAEIEAAQEADYLGFGPIFATQSKPLASLPPPHGIAGLRRAVQRSRIPVVAIGGITQANAGDVAAAGARCAAAIAELCGAPDPEGATRALAAAFGTAAGSRKPSAAPSGAR